MLRLTTTAIDYDENGDLQYEDDLDENGEQQLVYKLETRFIAADGFELPDKDSYDEYLASGRTGYIACFVGCTYHCG